MCRATRPKEEGRIAIVTNAGRAAVDADGIGAKGLAGRATVSKAVAHTTGAIGVRQNRVVLAPGVCAPSVAVMRRPDRARASISCKATGAIVQRSPGRARHKPFQPLRREGRDVPVALFSAMQQHTQSALGMAVHGSHRLPAFPAPSFNSEGEATSKARANKPRGCDPMSIIHRRSCPGRSAALPAMRSIVRCDALQSRGPCSGMCGLLGPGSAQQRLRAAARPGHEGDVRYQHTLRRPRAGRRHRKNGGEMPPPFDRVFIRHAWMLHARVLHAKSLTCRCRTRSAIGPPAAARWRRGRSPPSPSGDGCCGACRASGRRSIPASRC